MIVQQHNNSETNKLESHDLSFQNICVKKYAILILLVCQSTLSKYAGINPAHIAPKRKIIDAKLDANYTLKIDSSNVDPNYAALCVITKNDDIYNIWEFLSYHFKIGIGRIYLYDTGTNNWEQLDKIFELYSQFLGNGQLYYQYWNMPRSVPGKFNMQKHVYNICANDFAKKHTWLGFIDTDEFIVLRNDGINQASNIEDFLQQYEEYGGLSMNWAVFGSSGFEKHQNSTLKSYTKCYLHRNFKIFVNVRFWKALQMNVHNVEQNSLQHATLSFG
eukprot:TRINITY_DN29743_c0_g1_i7.p2 TRINITY_DN29743_c0_g1~~TRINITY_DN29743_c0_g1_i7.p2  ORF type:complete len:275 (-),score=15.61 TRINITY_DN29743_c0_g1_i7:58-882(-)